jgi:hypothetical protein
MSGSHPLMSMMSDPSHPLGFSSLKNGSDSVDILRSGPLFAVFEENPVNLMNAMEDMQGRARTRIPFEHPYSLGVYYRKSLNPHGPSTRPVFIATFEFSPMTCRSTGGGLWGALTGDRRRPAEVYLIGNTPSGRVNEGMCDCNFDRDEAQERLAEFAAKKLGLAEPFIYAGTTSEAWDPEYTD